MDLNSVDLNSKKHVKLSNKSYWVAYEEFGKEWLGLASI